MRSVYWLITGLATVVLVVFAVTNLQPVEVNLWLLTIDTRLYLIVLAALALGFFIGEIVAWIGGRRWRREARHRAQRITSLERELAAAQAHLKAGPKPDTALSGATLSTADNSAH